MMQRRNRFHIALVTAAMLPVTACYEYAPLTTSTVQVGETVTFEITDQGRVALTDRFGPGLARVEGKIVREDPNQFVLNVFSVAQLNGEKTMWSGETTTLQRAYLGTMNGRRFSRSRTAILAAGAAGVLGYLIASGRLTGSYSSPADQPPPEKPVSIRIPLGHRP